MAMGDRKSTEKSTGEHVKFALPCNSSGFLTHKRLLLLVIIVAVLITIFLIIGLLVSSRKSPKKDDFHTHTDKSTILTDGGRVKGTREDNAWVFKGIPYAKPPVGSLRWKPTQPCKSGDCWNGTFNATNFGNPCFQLEPGVQEPSGDEDCLTLNIWTPSLSSKRPVLVFIHGGELTYGSGHDAGVHPTPDLVKELGIVGVSINYRLNAFGFLALEALADGSPTNTSGNYGFMDQIMALTWVKKNIGNFGGDPGRVTLLGQSSGGTSEIALLASPLAKGLFHGAIIMSASAVFSKSSAAAAKDNKVFVKRAKCNAGSNADIRKCIYSLSDKKVIEAIPWDAYPYWNMLDLTDLPTVGHFNGALATVDGHVVTSPPLVAMTTNDHINDVPIIIGTTAQEVDYFPGKDFTNLSFAYFEKYVRTRLLTFLSKPEMDEVFKLYNINNTTSSMLQFSTMVTDIRATCPNDVFVQNASSGFHSPVYRYVVTNWPSKPVKLPIEESKASPYAFHMWDIQAFFGFPKELGYVPSQKDIVFMKNLREEFGYFIHSGKVKSSAWKSFPEKTGLFTNDGLRVTDSYHKKECEFWLRHGFFPYGWVN